MRQLGAPVGWVRFAPEVGVLEQQKLLHGMQPGEGEFSPFLFRAVLPGNGVHAQSPFEHQSLPDQHPDLQILGKVAPADNLQLAARIVSA